MQSKFDSFYYTYNTVEGSLETKKPIEATIITDTAFVIPIQECHAITPPLSVGFVINRETLNKLQELLFKYPHLTEILSKKINIAICEIIEKETGAATNAKV